jgi:hypothetical protein
MTTPRTYLAAGTLLLSAMLAPAWGGNLNFLDKSPVSYFKGDDMELMRQNALKVLDLPGADAKQSWSNPKTGASGLAQARGSFTGDDGAPCKHLRLLNKAGGLKNDATYVVCKYPDRGWVIHSDASPQH